MNILILIVSALVTWFIFQAIRNYQIDKQYHISCTGGRGGFLLYQNNEKAAKIEWEMLVGESDFVLYDEGLRWEKPKQEKFTPKEQELFYLNLEAWDSARKLKYQSEFKKKHLTAGLDKEPWYSVCSSKFGLFYPSSCHREKRLRCRS